MFYKVIPLLLLLQPQHSALSPHFGEEEGRGLGVIDPGIDLPIHSHLDLKALIVDANGGDIVLFLLDPSLPAAN